MQVLAGGNWTWRSPRWSAATKWVARAKAVLVFKEEMIRNATLEAEAKAQRPRSEAERRQSMMALADDFERTVGSIIGSVASASSQLHTTARA